ncbi:MAG: cadherin repeat domain-containing protein [Alphaproteobacteria bacterium]
MPARFAIDAATGVVTVADASLLDYETATSHTVTVQATSTDGSTSTQTFTVN